MYISSYVRVRVSLSVQHQLRHFFPSRALHAPNTDKIAYKQLQICFPADNIHKSENDEYFLSRLHLAFYALNSNRKKSKNFWIIFSHYPIFRQDYSYFEISNGLIFDTNFLALYIITADEVLPIPFITCFKIIAIKIKGHNFSSILLF